MRLGAAPPLGSRGDPARRADPARSGNTDRVRIPYHLSLQRFSRQIGGNPVSTGHVQDRWLNVVVGPESPTYRHTPHPHGRAPAAGGTRSPHLAAGFQPQPDWNLTDSGGPTIDELTFVSRYIGGEAAWAAADTQSIDTALSAALADNALQSVIAQYFPGVQITSAMLPSAIDPDPSPATVYRDTAEALATRLHANDALGAADPKKSVICMMLPQGVVLSDDFSPAYHPPAAEADAYTRRKRGVIKVSDDDAASSKDGLGGYHGSVHLADGTEIYYAVGVYSETGADGSVNGIDAFGTPWKNVVATFYHELNEARTDAAVEDVNSSGDDHLLGWYSQTGQGEIGDLPINACNGDLSLVFQEIALANGQGTVPIQLMWSNADGGPASSTGA
jgi:hypothetical protein